MTKLILRRRFTPVAETPVREVPIAGPPVYPIVKMLGSFPMQVWEGNILTVSQDNRQSFLFPDGSLMSRNIVMDVTRSGMALSAIIYSDGSISLEYEDD
jgi:hypothetical protein